MNEQDNLYDIAKSIFNNAIKPPKTYCLSLEEISLEIAEKQGFDEYIQGLLSIITVHGIEILYGHKNINILKENEIDTIKMYVKSYGYILKQKEFDNKLHWFFEIIL